MTIHPIKAFRSLHGLTLAQFGARIGVEKAAVSKWENDVQPVSVKAAIEIEAQFGPDLARWKLRPDVWDMPAREAAQ